jgi:hypothetical protein
MIHDYLTEMLTQLSHHKESMLFNGKKLLEHVTPSLDEQELIDKAKEAEIDPPPRQINPVYIELINSQNATHAAAISQVTGQLALMACMGVDNMPRIEQPGDDEKDMQN